MILNTKQYVDLPFDSEYGSYTMGISTATNLVDQQRNVIDILPGYQTIVKVIPQLLGTTGPFDAMDEFSRQCKLPHETQGLKLIRSYTRIGCEYECAATKAVEVCGCLPWYITNNFTGVPICEKFQGHCFHQIMSDESSYKKCLQLCKEDCSGTPLTIVTSYLPINTKISCQKGAYLYEHFMIASRKHFALENYKTLITGDGLIPDLATSLANGSLCSTYVEKFVAMVNVESPTSSVIKSSRETRVTFLDQLGTIGGTLGLFTGMSILSMVEVGFFIISFFRGCWKKDKKNKKNEPSTLFTRFFKPDESRDQHSQNECEKRMNDLQTEINDLQNMKVSFMEYTVYEKQVMFTCNTSEKSNIQ